ncbi:hypothetical protein P8452_13496 [Trifolium repens]|nr:hypothetical protein P8452_13496 [Trifolium repens]
MEEPYSYIKISDFLYGGARNSTKMEHAEKEEILHAEFWWTQRSGGGFHAARLNEDEVLQVTVILNPRKMEETLHPQRHTTV